MPRATITNEIRERIIEMYCSPKKRTIEEIAAANDMSGATAGRIIRTFVACRDDNEEAIIDLCCKTCTTEHFEFCMDFLGKEIDDDLRKRVSDALNVVLMEKNGVSIKHKEVKPSDVGGENLAAMLGKINEIIGTLNMLGAAVSERATEDVVAEGFKSLEKCINANFDVLMQEVRKQTQFLDNIRFNTSRKRD